jgi:hypothetical protein
VTGVVKMSDGDAAGQDFLKIGIAVVLVCWVLLIIWTLASLKGAYTDVDAVAYAEGRTVSARTPHQKQSKTDSILQLLYGVVAVLPFIGVREIYAAGSDFATSSDFTTSFALKVALSVVPEIIVVVILVYGGLKTRNISQVLRNGEKSSYSSRKQRQPMAQPEPYRGY